MSVQAFQALWPTPLGQHRFEQADSINPLLVRVFAAMRAADPGNDPDAAFYASGDDLLQRIQLAEWRALVGFIVERLGATVVQANQGHWPEGEQALQIALNGLWFQTSNHGAHHDVHTHGNCSWSGVYCLQVDAQHDRVRHPVYGARNGVTRFYGPAFAQLGGAHADFGNAYLQAAHLDVPPLSGQLIVFPSWLAHQALPYQGALDRVIVSFNASVHRRGASDQLRAYAAA
jgi:uncharacterized protein (TIGR02466 family)